MSRSMPSKATRVTVDVVIFTIRDGALQVLLVRRKYPPFKDRWAIPGGFVHDRETLEEAALRELREETGVSDVYLEQLYTFGDPGRDPRGRVVTIAYFALVSSDRELKASTDAAEVAWFTAAKPPPLAFDHGAILTYALSRLRLKLEYTTVGFQLLPKAFTLTELQRVYEAILGKRLDKRNFRRKMGVLKILEPVDGLRRDGLRRPAQLHRFSAAKFEKLRDRGILFPF